MDVNAVPTTLLLLPMEFVTAKTKTFLKKLKKKSMKFWKSCGVRWISPPPGMIEQKEHSICNYLP